MTHVPPTTLLLLCVEMAALSPPHQVNRLLKSLSTFSQIAFVGPPDCSDVCRLSEGDVTQLTEDDKTYAEETCLPLLKTWNKQYRVKYYHH